MLPVSRTVRSSDLVVTVVAGDGYGGDIKFSVRRFGADGTVPRNINSVNFSETAGLGMRAKTEPCISLHSLTSASVQISSYSC